MSVTSGSEDKMLLHNMSSRWLSHGLTLFSPVHLKSTTEPLNRTWTEWCRIRLTFELGPPEHVTPCFTRLHRLPVRCSSFTNSIHRYARCILSETFFGMSLALSAQPRQSRLRSSRLHHTTIHHGRKLRVQGGGRVPRICWVGTLIQIVHRFSKNTHSEFNKTRRFKRRFRVFSPRRRPNRVSPDRWPDVRHSSTQPNLLDPPLRLQPDIRLSESPLNQLNMLSHLQNHVLRVPYT